jgi:hypothetical protein
MTTSFTALPAAGSAVAMSVDAGAAALLADGAEPLGARLATVGADLICCAIGDPLLDLP